MKKALTFAALTVLLALPAFARYIVVLKDGTRYTAKAKWTVVNGKAIVKLENGQSLQLDPSLIDGPKSEQATKIGLANANVIDLNPNLPQPAQKQQQPSLGSQIKLRQRPTQPKTDTPPPAPTPAGSVAPISGAGSLPQSALEKFERAFENIGIFEHTVKSTGAHSVRADLTVDTEDRVFNALSATSFLMVRNAGVDNIQIDMVELFMKSTTGGAAGRFQMSRAEAEAIDKVGPALRQRTLQDYFIRKVIY